MIWRKKMIPYCKNNSNFTFREICCGPPLYDCNTNCSKNESKNCGNNNKCENDKNKNCHNDNNFWHCPFCGNYECEPPFPPCPPPKPKCPHHNSCNPPPPKCTHPCNPPFPPYKNCCNYFWFGVWSDSCNRNDNYE